jgi:hypothetical protein
MKTKMSKKIITDELITSELEKQGYLEYRDMEETDAWNLLQAHYNCEVHDQWRNKHYDFYCYEETTADGYSVYVATHNVDSVCVSEDVHYYDNDLSSEIVDAIKDGSTMYIDDLDAHYFMDAVEECYDDMYDKLRSQMEEQLIEQGYEHADTETIA